MFECMREVCGAGDRCGNQRFQKKIYPTLSSFKTEDRGWGLKTLQDLKKGWCATHAVNYVHQTLNLPTIFTFSQFCFVAPWHIKGTAQQNF